MATPRALGCRGRRSSNALVYRVLQLAPLPCHAFHTNFFYTGRPSHFCRTFIFTFPTFKSHKNSNASTIYPPPVPGLQRTLTCSARASFFWRYALVRVAPTAAKCPSSWPTWSLGGRPRTVCFVGRGRASAELSDSCRIRGILVQWPSQEIPSSTPNSV